MTPLSRFKGWVMNMTWETHTKRAPRTRRGNVIVLSAVLMAVVLGMVAFAVDIGYVVHMDTELQRTADACALAAVQQLPDQSNATGAAQSIAAKNKGKGGPDLHASDLQFGYWDRDTATFSSTSDEVNAVQVVVERTAEKGNPIELFFARVLGTSFADVSTTATAMYDNDLCGPLVGIEWVDVPGEPMTDSFRSADGSYASQEPRDNGNICSDGPIHADGSVVVNGDANAGRGYSTIQEGGAIVTGNTSPRLRPLHMPLVDTSAVEQDNDNDSLPGIQKGNHLVSPVDENGNFLVDGGNTYEMPPGTYLFNDFTLTGQSTLIITGPTNIYLTGSLDTSGGDVINDTEIASNLRIFMEGGSDSTALVTASSSLYAVIYAPQTAVETRGGADFFGAVVGQTLLATGSGQIHYDEDLDVSDALDLPQRISLVQ